MNKIIMWIQILSGILIFAGVLLLILTSIPVKNTLDGNTLTVDYILGKRVVDVSDAVFMPVPDDALHNIIRLNGTSIGKRCSGKFMNIKSKRKYTFYLTGKGEWLYFEIGNKRYLVDGIAVLPSIKK